MTGVIKPDGQVETYADDDPSIPLRGEASSMVTLDDVGFGFHEAFAEEEPQPEEDDVDRFLKWVNQYDAKQKIKTKKRKRKAQRKARRKNRK